MEIFLIRHTRPLLKPGLIYGQSEVPLAASFPLERDAVLEQLASAPDAVYSSPYSRCTRLAAAIDAGYHTVPALAELNFGDWEGQTWDTVDHLESETWMADFVHLSPPGGESLLQLQARVSGFWQWLLRQPRGRVAVVTHAGVIRVILARYRGIALQDIFSIPVQYAEVFRLEHNTQ